MGKMEPENLFSIFRGGPEEGRAAGVTLPEVVIAMFVLATALIPIFALLTQDVKETDILVSQTFAMDKARVVLNTILDEVPFANLTPGNPAVLTGPRAAEFANTLFPNAPVAAGGFACQGIASDSRGIHYQIYLRADPIEDTTATFTEGEMFFSYFRNPTVEGQAGWDTISTRAFQIETSGNAPSVFPSGPPDNPAGAVSPYRFLSPATTSSILWGPEYDFQTKTPIKLDQRMVTRANPDGRFYLMQRILLQIRWNLAMAEYSRPTSDTGRPQRFHVVTYKAKLE